MDEQPLLRQNSAYSDYSIASSFGGPSTYNSNNTATSTAAPSSSPSTLADDNDDSNNNTNNEKSSNEKNNNNNENSSSTSQQPPPPTAANNQMIAALSALEDAVKKGDAKRNGDDDGFLSDDDAFTSSADANKPKQLTDFDKQRVRLTNIIEVLSNDCDKMRHFAFLPIYFLMLISIFILLLWHRADSDEATSIIHFGEVISTYTNSSIFATMNDVDEARGPDYFMDNAVVILRGLIRDFIDTNVGAVWILPLAVLRQVRVENVACWTGSAFFSDSRVAINGTLPTCPGSWSDADNARDYSIFRRNTDSNIDFLTVSTPTENFDTPTNEFYTTLRMQNSSLFEEDLNRTIANGFVDSFTRGLVIDTVFNFPERGAVVILSMYWITTDGGLVIAAVQKNTFSLFSVHRGVISMDSVVLLLSLLLLTISILEVYDNFGRIDEAEYKNIKLTHVPSFFFRLISPWQLVTFATLGIIFAITVIRFAEWNTAQQWVNGVYQNTEPSASSLFLAYQEAVRSAGTFFTTYELYGYAFCLMTYRFGYAAQYLSKLSLVARTFKNSIADLMRVFNVFFISMIVFAMIFHAIFGQQILSMRTLFRTVVVLVRMIISGDADSVDYAQMRSSEYSVGADILLTFYFILFWLILLNFVLAIISSAFMNSYTEVRSVDTVLNVIQTYVLFNAPMYYVDRFHRPDDLTKMGGCRRAASAALSVPPSYYTRLKLLFMIWRWRVSSLNNLKAVLKKILRDRLDPTVARHELGALMPLEDSATGLKFVKKMKAMFRKKDPEKINLRGYGKPSNNDALSSPSPSSSSSSPTASSAAAAAAGGGGGGGGGGDDLMNASPQKSSATSVFGRPRSKTAIEQKRISKDRAKEAGHRAVAFLVNELFDAVHLREMAESRVALDTHAKTMRKLNRSAERIKHVYAYINNVEKESLGANSNASFGSFGGTWALGGAGRRNSSTTLASLVPKLMLSKSKSPSSGSLSNSSGATPGSLTPNALQLQQQGQQQHVTGGMRRGSQDSEGSEVELTEIDTRALEHQIRLHKHGSMTPSDMSGSSSSGSGGGRQGSNLSSLLQPSNSSIIARQQVMMEPSNSSFANPNQPRRISSKGGGTRVAFIGLDDSSSNNSSNKNSDPAQIAAAAVRDAEHTQDQQQRNDTTSYLSPNYSPQLNRADSDIQLGGRRGTLVTPSSANNNNDQLKQEHGGNFGRADSLHLDYYEMQPVVPAAASQNTGNSGARTTANDLLHRKPTQRQESDMMDALAALDSSTSTAPPEMNRNNSSIGLLGGEEEHEGSPDSITLEAVPSEFMTPSPSSGNHSPNIDSL